MSQRTRTPVVATTVITVIVALQILLIRAVWTEDSLEIFFWTSTYGTVTLLVAYILSTIGAARFLFFGPRPLVPRYEIVIPALALAFLVYTLWKNVDVAGSPYDKFPFMVAGWILIAVAIVLFVPGFARRIGESLRREAGLSDTAATEAARTSA